MMNSRLKYLLVCIVVVAAVVTLLPTGSAAAESGTVSVEKPVSGSPGETATVSFEVTNLANSPRAFIFDLSVPKGYTITDHTDADGLWNADESKWLWQTLQPGDAESKSPSITVKIPENATRSDTITGELKTASGVQQSITVDVKLDDTSEVRLINVQLKPDHREGGQLVRKLTFDVKNLSPDGNSDEILISMPDAVSKENIKSVRYNGQTVSSILPPAPFYVHNSPNELLIVVNPETQIRDTASVEIEFTLSKTGN